MYRIKVTIFLLLISLISVEIALSENYYVDTRLATASDDNSGLSPDQAWKTITKSFSVVQPGDSVLIANGTYRERMAFGSVSGTEDAPIVYKALGDSVVVTGATEIDNAKFEKVEGYENVFSIVYWPRIGNGEYRNMGVVETNHEAWDKQYERVTDPDNHSDWFFEHCPYYNWETSIGGVQKYEGSYFQYDSLVYIHPYRHLDPRTANLGIEFIQDQGVLVYFTANNDYIILDGIDLHYVAYEEIVYCQYAEGVQILNSWILGGRVMLHGPRNRIENCTIENVIIKGSDRIWDHKPALPYSALSVGGAGSIAKNNMIKNNWNGGQPASGVPGEPCIWDGNVNKNAPNHLSCHPINRGDHDIIYRNSVFINAQDGIYFDSVHDIVVENCILIWTFAQYLEIPAAKSDSSYNITFRNNIFLCDGYTLQNGCLEGFDSDYNLFFVKSPFQFQVKLGNSSFRSLSDLQAAGYDSNSIVVQNENIFANVPILMDYRDLEIADKVRTDFSPVEGAPQLNAGDPAYGTDYPGGRINIGPADLQPDSYTSNVRSPGDEQIEKPEKLTIKQNYPNPFNNSTCLVYSLPEDAHVEIDIYNMRGQHVETVFDGMQVAGEKKIFWNAESLGSGLYFCRISEGMNNEVVKLVLTK